MIGLNRRDLVVDDLRVELGLFEIEIAVGEEVEAVLAAGDAREEELADLVLDDAEDAGGRAPVDELAAAEVGARAGAVEGDAVVARGRARGAGARAPSARAQAYPARAT